MIYSIKTRDAAHTRRMEFSCLLHGLEVDVIDEEFVDVVSFSPESVLNVIRESGGGTIVAQVNTITSRR